MEIGEIMPILHEELIPGDSFNIGESVFARLAPLAVPTYGSFYFKTASMFVPYYQLKAMLKYRVDLWCKEFLKSESRIDFSRQPDAFLGVSDKPSPIADARGCDVLSVSLIP